MFKIYERYFISRPKLHVKFQKDPGITTSKLSLGVTPRNGPVLTAGSNLTWHLYRLTWNYELMVTNNSEVNAYSVKLLQHTNAPQIKFKNNFDQNIPFKSHEQIVLPFSIIIEEELRSIDADNKIKSKPEIFKDLMILIDYQNPKETHFQSRYFFNTDKTSYRKIARKEIEKFWK